IEVARVTSKRAVLIWKNAPLHHILPDWENRTVPMDSGGLATNQKDVMIDTVTMNVAFVLTPNQTFVPRSMSIVEGYVQPLPFRPADEARAMWEKEQNLRMGKPPATTENGETAEEEAMEPAPVITRPDPQKL